MDNLGYMRTCNRCGGIDTGGKIHHTDDCLFGKAEKLEIAEGLLIVAELALEKLRDKADRRLEMLRVAEQTLRNLANGELQGDAKQIANNAAANIRKELSDAT